MKSGWHQMAKGESEMSWYAEVILSYIIIEKQSDMERRHGSPHIVTSHSFFSHDFSVVFITESHEELLGKEWWLCWGEKNKKNQAARLFVQKNACGWYVASKSPPFTPFQMIHSCLGGKKAYLGNQWITVGVWCWSKKGRFSIFPCSVAPRG